MEFLQSYKTTLQTFAERQELVKEPKGLYDPVAYILSLGGKRIRPILTLMASNAFGEVCEETLSAAWAIELFHNFSLMHDDIMDAAPLRRGKETVHIKYDSNTAILSGDAMLILAYQYLHTAARKGGIELYDIFNRTSIEVCEGQQMDMDFEKRDDVSISDYIEMIRLKTSVLLGASSQLGALLGGASEEQAKHMYAYGMNAGIAFQIQDDVLDIYGTPKVGKQASGDIIQNKKTYLYLKALESASADEKDILRKHYTSTPDDPTEKIAEVKSIFKNANARGYADELKLVYKDLALSHLAAAKVNDKAMEEFKQLTSYILDRNS